MNFNISGSYHVARNRRVERCPKTVVHVISPTAESFKAQLHHEQEEDPQACSGRQFKVLSGPQQRTFECSHFFHNHSFYQCLSKRSCSEWNITHEPLLPRVLSEMLFWALGLNWKQRGPLRSSFFSLLLQMVKTICPVLAPTDRIWTAKKENTTRSQWHDQKSSPSVVRLEQGILEKTERKRVCVRACVCVCVCVRVCVRLRVRGRTQIIHAIHE